MSQTNLIYIIKDAIMTMLLVAAPFLAVTCIIGLLVSVIQAATQIQEQSIAFIFKMVAVSVILVLLGSWMISTMTEYTQRIFENISSMY